MNPRELKEKLMDEGKTLADLARELCEEFPNVAYTSMYTTLDDMFKGRRYFPKYARSLRLRGYDIERPAWLKPAAELYRQKAA